MLLVWSGIYGTDMSKASSVKQCDIFTRRRKTGAIPSTSDTDANMASIAEVLDELKSLRSDFGAKLDSIDIRLTGMASAVTALEGKVSEVKQDILNQGAHIEEAEARIAEVESTLEKTETSLNSAIKRIALLEAKTDDLENRGRRKNLRIFGIKEGAEGQQSLFEFINIMLPKWLGLAPDKSFTLERVHRTLASGKPNQSRAVLIRFLKFQEKELVYREARKQQITHDGAKITFAQDLSAETVRIRRGFHPVVKLFIDINAFRGFQHNPCRLRILYGGKIHLFSTPQEAEKFYKNLPKETAEDAHHQ
ncbi:uncharacterized protein LOC113020645 [Astatotilapia calliptera]|uniref:uncharacterized protein LOC113020645 n=1 Tax=Astatotilapia calliptera TaxID=8154 RepID=UPI000E4233C7|nr:uncharacterized protein LOC113020645 [Astatotilapia calliptera]